MKHDTELLTKEDLLNLVECSSTLAAEIDPDRLVAKVLAKACEMTDSADGSVLLVDELRGGLFFAAAVGEKAPNLLASWGEASSQRVPMESQAGQALKDGRTVVQLQVEVGSGFKGVEEQTQKKIESMITVPLVSEGKGIGVLQNLNKRTGDYTPRDMVLLEMFAGQASLAIRNGRLIRDLVAQRGLYSREETGDLLARLHEPAKRERMTMLFADLRGFTQLCQSQGNPADTQSIMNDLLTMLSDEVLSFNGTVNKFMGDSVFGFFRGKTGAPQSVRCAFSMLEKFESLRRRWDTISNQDLSFLDLGIGIASDEVTVGMIGSGRVRDFTAIGTAVNLAAAFEREARDGRRVLVDQTTWTAAKDLIADYEGPTPYELRKPGQEVGIKYRQYHVKRLRPAVPVRVFVSHNHRDRAFVEGTITGPLKQLGIETWYSNADIVPGENYIRAIEEGLLKSDWVIVVVSQHSTSSDWVRAEVRSALGDPRLAGRILPVRLDDSKQDLIHTDIGQLHAIDARVEKELGDRLLEQFVPKPD